MKVQAKHIDESLVLAAIDKVKQSHRPGVACAATWNIQAALPQFPPKVVLARLRSMHRRRVIDAQCDCGCRGDWCRPEESPPWSAWAGRPT